MSRTFHKSLAFVLFASLIGWIVQLSVHVDLPVADQPAHFYATQCRDDLRLLYEKAIESANHSIELTIYSITDYHLLRLLKNKANSGVTVTVIVDKNNGGYIRKYLGPNVTLIKRKIRGLMHRKLLVVDSHLVLTGSSNLTSESLWLHDNLVVGWDSLELADIIHQKNSTIISEQTPYSLPIKEQFINGQLVETWFLPEDKEALARLIQLIDGAQKTVRIAMFTWSHQKLAETVVAAHNRGIDVKVVIDARSSEGASQKVVELLQKGGIWVGKNRGSQLLHHKFAYIDDSILCNGSTNWTKAAFKSNEDVFFVIHNLTDQQRQFMQRLWHIIESESNVNIVIDIASF